jgi:hypothetical protein
MKKDNSEKWANRYAITVTISMAVALIICIMAVLIVLIYDINKDIQQEELLWKVWHDQSQSSPVIIRREGDARVHDPVFFVMDVAFESETLTFTRGVNKSGHNSHGYQDWDCMPKKTQAHTDFINSLRAVDETPKFEYFKMAFRRTSFNEHTEQTDKP